MKHKMAEPKGPFPALPCLTEEHLDHLTQSGISQEILRRAGVHSVATAEALKEIGHGSAPIPGIAFPTWTPRGDSGHARYRPDNPSTNSSGKPVKYIQPKGVKLRLYTPQLTLELLEKSPESVLLITEGEKKALSALSIGYPAASLPGVYAFRGPEVLADFEALIKQGMKAIIVFDSDASTNRNVLNAQRGLFKLLKSLGARPVIARIGPAQDGSKQGLDDFLVNGGKIENLIHQAELGSSLGRTTASTSALMRGSNPSAIASFDAEVLEEICWLEPDQSTILRVRFRCGSEERTLTLSKADFSSGAYVDWLPASFLFHECSRKAPHEFAVSAINKPKPFPRLIRARRSGWHEVEAGPAFLFHGGAITSEGITHDLAAELNGPLRQACFQKLPSPDELKSWLVQLLAFARVSEPSVSAALLAAPFLAPIKPANFPVMIVGPTQSQKTSLGVVCQSFFGRGFALPENLPASFKSTVNAIECEAAPAKDILFLLDDYVPGAGGGGTQTGLEAVLRGVGNRTSRSRLDKDFAVKQSPAFEGVLMVTGESSKSRESARARMLCLHLQKGDVDLTALSKLQDMARTGVLEGIMASFIQWIALKRSELQSELETLVHDSRSGRRASEQITHIIFALGTLKRFCLEKGLSEDQLAPLKELIVNAETDLAKRVAEQESDFSSALEFRALLQSLLVQGAVIIEGMEKASEPALSGQRPARDSRWVGFARELSGEAMVDISAVLAKAKTSGMEVDPSMSDVRALRSALKAAGALSRWDRDKLTATAAYMGRTLRLTAIKIDWLNEA